MGLGHHHTKSTYLETETLFITVLKSESLPRRTP
jgi:hypothetical protein